MSDYSPPLITSTLTGEEEEGMKWGGGGGR